MSKKKKPEQHVTDPSKVKPLDVERMKKENRKRRTKWLISVTIRYCLILTFAIWAIVDSSNYSNYITSLYYVLNGFGIFMIGLVIFGVLENTGLIKKIFPNYGNLKDKKTKKRD